MTRYTTHPRRKDRRLDAIDQVERRIEHLEHPDGPWWRGATLAELSREERDTKLAIHRRDLDNLRKKV